MAQDILQKIVTANLDFVVTEILPLIDKDYARVAATEVVDRLKQTVVALTDDVVGNKDQIDLIWGSLTSDPELVAAFRSALLDAISKIDDAQIKTGLTLLLTPVTQTLVAITDSVKPDGAQLKAIWNGFLESPEFIVFLVSNLGWILSKIIKDKKALDWITKLINAFIH